MFALRESIVYYVSMIVWLAVVWASVPYLGAVEPAAEPAPAVAPDSKQAEPKPGADAQPDRKKPAAGVLDDNPEPFVPRTTRTEKQQNRIEALSLFSLARMHEQNEENAEALRLYQRALRYDPESLPILREIIPLAFSLDRAAEGVRYALKAVELDPSDPLLLRRLGVLLTERGEFAGALKLYEKALGLAGDKKSASYVMLRMEMGRLYFVTEHYREAADSFAEVMDALAKPNEAGLNSTQQAAFAGDEGRKSYELFGEAFLEADMPDRALAAYEKAEKLVANKALHAYALARVYAKKKEPAKALEQLQIYFDEHATSRGRGPYELLAKVLAEMGQQASLIERLQKIADAEPKNEPVRYVLADRCLAADNLDQAEALYVALLKDSSPAPDAYCGLVKIYRLKKDPGPLLRALGQAASKTTGLEVVEEEAKAIAKDAELFGKLADWAKAAYTKDADSVNYGERLALALLALEAKRYPVANEFFELALKVKRDEPAELLLTWGLGMLVAEQYADAARVFQKGIDAKALGADNPGFHYYLAGALEMADKTNEALEVARAAVRMAPASARMHGRVGWVLYHAKRYAEAQASYQELIARFDSQRQSDETRAALRDARLVLSNICVIQKNLPQAEEWLEQVLDEYPENVSALNDLGYLWADQGKNLERALDMVQRAVAGDPENGAYRDSLGWALYRLGRFDEAVFELNKALAGDDPDGVILDHLGDVYLAQGKLNEARDCWQKALAAFTRHKETDKIEEVNAKLKKHAEGK
jgi:tetratricopeptide (TPR) repeat protein